MLPDILSGHTRNFFDTSPRSVNYIHSCACVCLGVCEATAYTPVLETVKVLSKALIPEP